MGTEKSSLVDCSTENDTQDVSYLYFVFLFPMKIQRPPGTNMRSSPLLSTLARRLEGKVAVVTGGAKVVVADIDDEKGEEVCRDIVGNGGVASYVRCDVSDEGDFQAAVNAALKAHGRLDVFHNNAGIVTDNKPFLDVEKSEVERVLAVNVIGVFLGMKHTGRAMTEASRGSIINMSSCPAVMAAMSVPQYSASKHAVVGLTRDGAVQFGKYGVRVNCVSPFAVATPLACSAVEKEAETLEAVAEKVSVLKVPALKAEDVAETVLFLASDESRYINGHNVRVDGGYTITNPTFAQQIYSSS